MFDSGESVMYALKVMQEKRVKRAAMVKNGWLVGRLNEDLGKKQVDVPLKTCVRRK